jgi:hypothetical protein
MVVMGPLYENSRIRRYAPDGKVKADYYIRYFPALNTSTPAFADSWVWLSNIGPSQAEKYRRERELGTSTAATGSQALRQIAETRRTAVGLVMTLDGTQFASKLVKQTIHGNPATPSIASPGTDDAERGIRLLSTDIQMHNLQLS